FWGCRNFKGNAALSCKNGKDPASIQWPDLES
ncbi:MAG: DNA helicase-4, partial [Colwellia sp.]